MVPLTFLTKTFSLSFIVLWFAGCIQNNLGEPKKYFEYQANISAAQNSVVAIVARDAEGEVTTPDCTGFFISPRTIATAFHCVEGDATRILDTSEGFLLQVNLDENQKPILGKEILFVTFEEHNNFIDNYDSASSPTITRSFVKDFNVEKDIAILELAPDESSSSHWLPLYNGEVFSGNHVYSLGMPINNLWILTEGIVSSMKRFPDGKTEIIHQTSIAPGSSGSPLLDDRGRVIGLTTRKFIKLPYLGIATPAIHLDNLRNGTQGQKLVIQITIDEYLDYISSQQACDPNITSCLE